MIGLRRIAAIVVMMVCGVGAALLGAGAAGAAVPCSVSLRCSLRFVVQPTNAVVGRSITGAADNPSGTPVTVEVVDGDGRLVTSSSALITIAIGANPGSATLGGTTSVHASGGIAHFSTLNLNAPATGYTLTASSPSIQGVTSSPFNITSSSERCQQNLTCQTTVNTPASDFQVIANPDPSRPNSGTLNVSLNVGAALQCTGYVPQDTNWWEFVMSSANRSKTIVYTSKMPHLTGTPPTPSATVNDIQVCFGATSVFTTRSGAPAAPGTLPDGTPGFIGLLPNCPASGPCILSRQSVPDVSSPTGFDIVVTISVPESLAGDPWART